jgi:hypothetical protein
VNADRIATAQTMRDEFGPGASDEYRTVYRFDSSAYGAVVQFWGYSRTLAGSSVYFPAAEPLTSPPLVACQEKANSGGRTATTVAAQRAKTGR